MDLTKLNKAVEKRFRLKKSTEEILKIANQVESAGAGHFDRSGKDMTIWVKGKNGWENARRIAAAIGSQASSPKADPQSGHIVIKVKDVYK